ncbi:hypothetical protein B9Z55_019531 [Caenorhabditis nigoni]|uniref:Uncharacterized protein n=1 Tax=Caenorhabditis nigoni TaxID=1611254 RepID=A0A2G5TIT0_9PELO|nr:hypothetical protein B9Z55_019531 [Caenorhabditis nigoni]
MTLFQCAGAEMDILEKRETQAYQSKRPDKSGGFLDRRKTKREETKREETKAAETKREEQKRAAFLRKKHAEDCKWAGQESSFVFF